MDPSNSSFRKYHDRTDQPPTVTRCILCKFVLSCSKSKVFKFPMHVHVCNIYVNTISNPLSFPKPTKNYPTCCPRNTTIFVSRTTMIIRLFLKPNNYTCPNLKHKNWLNSCGIRLPHPTKILFLHVAGFRGSPHLKNLLSGICFIDIFFNVKRRGMLENSRKEAIVQGREVFAVDRQLKIRNGTAGWFASSL